MLNTLLRMGLGCVHVKGDSRSNLPPRPFKGLRVVFTDLHLASHVGKDAASHTAKVFSKVVSPETAPVVVIIWSKYKDDVPIDEGPTEAELFKTTLLESFPQYQERLIFLEMVKPKLTDRPTTAKWVKELKTNITKQLGKVSAFDALWAWESSVRDAAIQVTGGLTTLALLPDINPPADGTTTALLPEKLKLALRLLVREQGGPNCSSSSAPGHLSTVLGQSLVDYLEHMDGHKAMSKHGAWLSDQSGLPKSCAIGPGVNGFLLTAALGSKPNPFIPGTVYRFKTRSKFKELFGVTREQLIDECYKGKPNNLEEWKRVNAPEEVLIELSPSCDVHQGTRCNALLLGGLIFPAEAKKLIRRGDGVETLPTFSLRWPIEEFTHQHAFLAFFSRLKITLRPTREPRWSIPWFRLRELPAASVRNWHSGHASRVGYVSL